MQLKSFAVALSTISSVQFLAEAVAQVNGKDYYQTFTTNINPLNITIPSIPEMTTYNITAECVDYNPDPTLVPFTQADWPIVWETATSNNMSTSAEFTSLYNSIDWTKVPNIPVRNTSAPDTLNTAGYDTATDPDCWWSATLCTIPKAADVYPDIYYCPEPETWGLTYDDGPNCSHNAFYDYLDENNLKATMFYIGSNVIDWPYGAMRGIRDGHHIAAHTWSHQLMTTLTNQELLAEFYYTQKAIKLVTGVTPLYWRPPFGDVDDRVRWIATQLNLTAVIWNLDTDDWNAGYGVTVQTVEDSYEQYIQMGSNGSFANSGNIVLTHEIDNTTMSLALENLPNIMTNYKHVVNVATCHNITFPYFEQTIGFRSFKDAIDANSTAGIAASSLPSSTLNGSSSNSGSSPAAGTNEGAAGFVYRTALLTVTCLALAFNLI